jgi:NAD(P)-dependent dehydrogenase (short-subunit alcohol dehydrogenase family)
MSEPTTPPATDYPSLLRLDGQTAVVLGGGFGIGRETCLALTQAGARVFCVDLDASRAEAMAAEVNGEALIADVTKRQDVEILFDKVLQSAGRVDCVVDIVGRADIGPLADVDDAGWADQLDVVLTHGLLAMQIGGHAVTISGGGSMVFVGSISGMTSLPGQTAYGAAKAALLHLVKGMAQELAPSVRVNAVAPGFVKTPRLCEIVGDKGWDALAKVIPIGAAAEPAEIASVILFLASGLASHITGQTILTDGGVAGHVPLPKLW